MKIAVQVYSVRDHINDTETLLKTLEEIKKIGYDGVEFAGFFNTDAATIKAKLDEIGLVAVGSHMSLDDFKEDKLEATIEYINTLGAKAIGVGGAPHSTMEESVNTGDELGNAQKYAMDKYGIKTYYHNHCEEFVPFEDGTLPIDIIQAKCDLEIDTYWSFHAGQDNFALLNEKKDSIVHIHVKDGIDGKPKALGEGNCDIPTVIKAAKSIGLEWIIVENDDPVPTGIDDITRSFNYLKSII
ncbi:MAG: sugar phosphate isomerase/epimerase [Clostridia bacterium]|nr:sugar phosphate isomerase/epimerase [Clostridia bacterium]